MDKTTEIEQTKIAAHNLDIPEEERLFIGLKARKRVLQAHTSAHRAMELESYVQQLMHHEAWSAAELA
jgi:hypothetical protein